MIVYDLNSGHREYPGYDEIEDRRGGGRADGFPKVFKCENELVKATLMYLDDPDAPEGVAFIRWLAVQDYLGEKINWKDLT